MERAIQARDLALAFVREKGVQQLVDDFRVLAAEHGEITIMHRTPFSGDIGPCPTPAQKYALAAAGARYTANLPYASTLWARLRKVLNIEWDDNGKVEVLGYKPGEWEADLTRMSDL